MKKSIYKVLSVIMIMAISLSITVFAEDEAVKLAETNAKLVIDSDVKAKAGETVTVNVALAGGVNVKNFSVKNLEYDTNALELVAADVVKIGDPTIADWMNGALAVTYAEEMAECTGVVLKLQFKVNDMATTGLYEISCKSQINKEDIAVEAGKIFVDGKMPVVEETDENEDFESKEPDVELTSKERAEDVICLKIDNPAAFAFGNFGLIDSANDKVVPYIKNDRTLVPLRFVSETLGAKVEWEDGWNYCYVNKGDKKIKITFGSADIEVNGEVITYDAPVEVVQDRTMVPIRFISEELGYHVYWNQPNRVVVITPKDNPWVEERSAENTLLLDMLVSFLMNGIM